MHGAAMTAQNASMGWVFDVAGLHRQGARGAQWREGLVLGVPHRPALPWLTATKTGFCDSDHRQSA